MVIEISDYGDRQYATMYNFKDEVGKKRMIYPYPFVCWRCNQPIYNDGVEAKSLSVHSLDGNHDNWNKENKVPMHRGCHRKHHQTGKIFNEELKKKLSIIAKEKTWPKRREKYGPSGIKNIDEFRDKMRIINNEPRRRKNV